MFRKTLFCVFGFFLMFSLVYSAYACDASGCAFAHSGMNHASDEIKPWFFDFSVEQQNWDVLDPREAHTLHHQGHDVHDKTHEEFYHFTIGANPSEDLTLVAQMPYVVRSFLDIHSHATLGDKMTSEGIGDLNLSAIYRFLKKTQGFLGGVAGVKLPTGSSTEVDDAGDLYEPELQPGSGSYDYTVGAVFQYIQGELHFHGNVLYSLKGEGDQEFEYGDTFSSYLVLDYLLNPQSSNFKTEIGLNLNIQVEAKEKSSGIKVDDSGGTTLLLGPALSIEANDHVSIFGNFLFPVYQNLGGVHQELDYVWNAGAKIAW